MKSTGTQPTPRWQQRQNAQGAMSGGCAQGQARGARGEAEPDDPTAARPGSPAPTAVPAAASLGGARASQPAPEPRPDPPRTSMPSPPRRPPLAAQHGRVGAGPPSPDGAGPGPGGPETRPAAAPEARTPRAGVGGAREAGHTLWEGEARLGEETKLAGRDGASPEPCRDPRD